MGQGHLGPQLQTLQDLAPQQLLLPTLQHAVHGYCPSHHACKCPTLSLGPRVGMTEPVLFSNACQSHQAVVFEAVYPSMLLCCTA